MNKLLLLLLLLIFSSMPAQAWQIESNYTNLYPSIRAYNTTYYNNDSNPLLVNIIINRHTISPDGNLFLETFFYVNDSVYDASNLYFYPNDALNYSIRAFIPSSSSYRVQCKVSYFDSENLCDDMVWYEWNTTDIGGNTMDLTNVLLLITAFCSLLIVIYILWKEVHR